jgi:hypothetical protein
LAKRLGFPVFSEPKAAAPKKAKNKQVQRIPEIME